MKQHVVLQRLRLSNKLGQRYMAKKMGMKDSCLSKIENGKRAVSLVILQRYAKYFDIPVSELVFIIQNHDKEIFGRVADALSNKSLNLIKILQGETK